MKNILKLKRKYFHFRFLMMRTAALKRNFTSVWTTNILFMFRYFWHFIFKSDFLIWVSKLPLKIQMSVLNYIDRPFGLVKISQLMTFRPNEKCIYCNFPRFPSNFVLKNVICNNYVILIYYVIKQHMLPIFN